MHHAPPPPACLADRVDWTVTAQGATQGLMVSIGLFSGRACRLPARPQVQLLVGSRPARVRRVPLRLSSEDLPRRTIGPKQPATAILRWENWCGRSGPVALRLTLGGVSVVRQLGSATTKPPVCASRTTGSTLAVSLFVRR